MSHVTVGWVLAQVDDLLPNSYTDEQKRHWLRQAECFAALELGAALPGSLDDGDELLIGLPYDGLYSRYVEAQIHFANREMERYNNAMTAWNELFLSWRDYCARGGAQPKRAGALKFF